MTGPKFGAAAVLATVVLAAGCAPKPPDYESIWAPTATPSEKPVPLGDYLKSIDVSGEQVAPDTLKDLKVSMPTPPGWQAIDKPGDNPATVAIRKGDSYPTAMLMVFKLNGDFDAADVAKHSFADTATAPNFKRLGSSDADFHGFPSAMLEGSVNDSAGQRIHSYLRVVVPTGAPPARQRYLVQLTIATAAEQAEAQAADVGAIIRGFTVAVP